MACHAEEHRENEKKQTTPQHMTAQQIEQQRKAGKWQQEERSQHGAHASQHDREHQARSLGCDPRSWSEKKIASRPKRAHTDRTQPKPQMDPEAASYDEWEGRLKILPNTPGHAMQPESEIRCENTAHCVKPTNSAPSA